MPNAVFSDLADPLQDLSCGPEADPEFLVSDAGQIFSNFLAQNCEFGLVWLGYMIRLFRILLNFLQNFCVLLQPLARSASHPQLRVLQALKHVTVDVWRIEREGWKTRMLARECWQNGRTLQQFELISKNSTCFNTVQAFMSRHFYHSCRYIWWVMHLCHFADVTKFLQWIKQLFVCIFCLTTLITSRYLFIIYYFCGP